MNENHDPKSGEFSSGGGGAATNKDAHARMDENAKKVADQQKAAKEYFDARARGENPKDLPPHLKALQAKAAEYDRHRENTSKASHTITDRTPAGYGPGGQNAHGQDAKTAASVRSNIRNARKFQLNKPPSQRRSVP